MNLNTTLYCQLSGLVIGKLETETTIGVLPYIASWDKLIVRHPVFNMNHYKLFVFAKTEWDRLAKRVTEEETTDKEERMLRVTYLAVLHTLGTIKQDQPILPPLNIVQTTLAKLLAVATWKYNVDSQRLKLPWYHICEANGNLEFQDVHNYYDACFAAMDAYSSKKKELEEEEKVRAADAALKALTNEWVTPVSRKTIWRWIFSYLKDTQYAADAEGWMRTLFLGGGNAIIEFQEEDLELWEDIITSECPNGTGVMSAVKERIKAVWNIWKQHHRAFDIDLAGYAKNQGVKVNGVDIQHPDPGEMPIACAATPKGVKLTIAIAKWTIAKAAWDKQNRKSDDPTINDQLGEL